MTDSESALAALCSFLETHSATLVLDDPVPKARTDRREDILIAQYVSSILGANESIGRSLTALLQGLVLARAVTLSDLAEIERRLSELVVYFDTPFVLALGGMFGQIDHEAAHEAVRLLTGLGATAAAFDSTIAEVRRILAVYEDRLDTASGREGLHHTPLTAFFFSTNATGSDVRTRSALLEATLGNEGLMIYATPPRQRELVGNEIGLAKALQAFRGEGYEARVFHNVDCVAAILTLRRGCQPNKLEDARAIFATSGLVLRTIRQWSVKTEERAYRQYSTKRRSSTIAGSNDHG